jgi:S-adenosylmethionine:tRNA ribosyltransferase-isomerase
MVVSRAEGSFRGGQFTGSFSNAGSTWKLAGVKKASHMLVSDFDYDLPESLIAQEPAARRDMSRLLVVDRASRTFTDSSFSELPSYLKYGDVVVLNNTRVFPARLIGHKLRPCAARKPAAGGRVEVFLVRELEPCVWEALVKPGRGLTAGARVEFAASELTAEVLEWRAGGRRLIRLEARDDLDSLIDRIGQTPLPPYIKRDQDKQLDAERYQTVYASERGAIAAPTAGLHFTAPLLKSIASRGIEIVEITLHVGYGTFQPVRAEQVEDHRVEPESYTITDSAAKRLNAALIGGRRILAVGTTTTRALESAALEARVGGSALAGEAGAQDQATREESRAGDPRQPRINAGIKTTDLFIYPGFDFGVVRGLITNFHLPRSSLLMLVSAFAGRELVLVAYRHAVEGEYRFYSYGDAMLIL